MTNVDLSWMQDYFPIVSFLLVFTVVFALLMKTEVLGKNKFIQLVTSFLMAIIFVGVTSAREYVVRITPWFVVMLLCLVFVLMLIGFAGKIPEGFHKGIGIVFVIALIILFLVSAYFTFSNTPFVDTLRDWVSSPKVYGALLLVVLSAIVSWVLIKTK